MKILTLNIHSYIEQNWEKKLEIFVDTITRIKPDVIALQEVNQRADSETLTGENDLVFSQFGIKLKKDNYGLRILEELSKRGTKYNFVWLGIKRGFKVFDEGLCFLCRNSIEDAYAFKISSTDDINNWKKRMALCIESEDETFVNVHMGRFDDEEELFLKQWHKLSEEIKGKSPVWLMGDFNSPSDVKGEGYDSIISSGLYDTFLLSEKRDSGYTVRGTIAGWEDKECGFENKRIDYIFTDTKRSINSSMTIFNGENEPVISDHFGILLDYEREQNV